MKPNEKIRYNGYLPSVCGNDSAALREPPGNLEHKRTNCSINFASEETQFRL